MKYLSTFILILIAILSGAAEVFVTVDDSKPMPWIDIANQTGALIAPTSPSVGDMVRWDGTNWIKSGSYVPILGYPILCAASNLTHDATMRSVAVLNTDQIPTGAKALNIQIEAQSTNANRSVTIGSTTNLLEGIGMIYVANIKTYFDCAVAWTNNQTTLGYTSNLQGSNEVNRRASVYLLGVWY